MSKKAEIKNWLLIGHSSLEDGHAIVKKFTGTEAKAKSLLVKEIKAERRNAVKNEEKALDFGTEKVSDLTNNSWSTNAKWYGYSSYDDCHVDFMLYDLDAVEEVVG